MWPPGSVSFSNPFFFSVNFIFYQQSWSFVLPLPSLARIIAIYLVNQTMACIANRHVWRWKWKETSGSILKGWQFTVQQHNAPPPTSPSSGDCTVKDIEETKRLQQLEPIERCLKNPPAEGSYGPFSLDMRVRDTICIGDIMAHILWMSLFLSLLVFQPSAVSASL